MCYIVFISYSLHWRYVKIALQEYVIKYIRGTSCLCGESHDLCGGYHQCIGGVPQQ